MSMFFRTLVPPRTSDLEAVESGFRWLRHHSPDGGWQMGEQGILDTIVATLGLEPGVAVEVGAGDGVTLPLTLSRLAAAGWSVVAYEADQSSARTLGLRHPGVQVVNERVTGGGELPRGMSVLVLDIDGGELHILRTMVAKPDVIIVEHADLDRNDNIGSPDTEILGWGLTAGYTLVARTRYNSVLVANERAPALKREPEPIKADRVWINEAEAPEGWYHIKAPFRSLPLPFADNSVSEIAFACCLCLETMHTQYDFTKELYRVLKPGGRLYAAEPSMELASQAIRGEVDIRAEWLMYGLGRSNNEHYRSGFDTNGLLLILRSSGFFAARLWDGKIGDTEMVGNVCCRVWCRKPSPAGDAAIRNDRIAAVLSAGRSVNTFTAGFLQNLASSMGIYTNMSVGVFYRQCMERLLTEYSKTHEWILTVDGDTVFQPDDVRELLAIAEQYPEGDAFAPLQCRRGDGAILHKSSTGQTPITEFHAEVFEATAAHFGLTLIRSSALLKMKHPWFMPHTDADGTWGDGRVDDDMHFWKVFTEAGNRLFVCPFVHIGHIEEMVAWRTNDCSGTIHQYISDYCTNGKPKEAR